MNSPSGRVGRCGKAQPTKPYSRQTTHGSRPGVEKSQTAHVQLQQREWDKQDAPGRPPFARPVKKYKLNRTDACNTHQSPYRTVPCAARSKAHPNPIQPNPPPPKPHAPPPPGDTRPLLPLPSGALIDSPHPPLAASSDGNPLPSSCKNPPSTGPPSAVEGPEAGDDGTPPAWWLPLPLPRAATAALASAAAAFCLASLIASAAVRPGVKPSWDGGRITAPVTASTVAVPRVGPPPPPLPPE